VTGTRTALPALGGVSGLFQALHDMDVRYCHWKSNQHLRASMLGRTDLDVLVDRRDGRRLAALLAELDFKRLQLPDRRSYPGVESYVGMDAETGTLVHLHLHHRLTLGEPDLKGYRLPWEERLLSTRVLNEEEGVFVADPHLEFLLLVIRAALKVRARDRVLERLGHPYLRQSLRREWEWLAARVERARLDSLGRELVGARATAALVELAATPPDRIRPLTDFAGAVVPRLDEYRSYSRLGGRLRRWWREAARVLAGRTRRLGLLLPTRRLLPNGGLVIAFVGVDGSGKSTLAREIGRWLRPFVEVEPVYFGTGQGPVSPPRRLLEELAALTRRKRRAAPPADPESAGAGDPSCTPERWRGGGASRLRTAGELMWVWCVARERERRSARARRARDRGMVVLCDRFPQSRTPGNDGPCLGHWLDDSGWARRTMARRELAAIQRAERLRPDLLVKLKVTPEIALRRKPETRPALLHRKLRIVEDLRLSTETRVVEIDATRPVGEVTLDVRRAVWSAL
jgi:thymidylate kinase